MAEQSFLSDASFEALLGSRHYLPFEGGLLFYHQELGKHVVAIFDNDVEYTAEHYYQLPEGLPYQLINGKFVHTMGASTQHQRISFNLILEIGSYIRANKLGELFHPPYDVQLGEKNVYQPDILFISVARQSQIKKNRIIGAPEFVVEILSKSTERIDRTTKMTQYGEYDVVEYWLVHPTDEFIEVYHNNDQQMQLAQTALRGDTITSKAIEGFCLEVDRVF